MLSRLSSALSVRSRLIVLSLIPVIGFAAVGLSYLSSERAVDQAFSSVEQSARLAETSRAFKDALVAMQMSAKDYGRSRNRVWRAASIRRKSRARQLEDAAGLVEDADKQTMVGLQGRVANLKASFAALTAEQDNLGLTEFEGIQGSLRDNAMRSSRSSASISRLSDADHRKLMLPLMLMRRYEVEYRLTHGGPVQSLFRQELDTFQKTFANIAISRQPSRSWPIR